MTDRELLEFAAKAAGLQRCENYYTDAAGNHDYYTDAAGNHVEWNPITDDGDALRLAVKLQKMPVIERWSNGHDWVFIPGHEGDAEPLGNDPHAATRRAIVRAAAEIGKGME